MRFKPRSSEYEVLDRLDEIQIQNGNGKFYYQLSNGLTSLSFYGMMQIASVNRLNLIDTVEVRENGTIEAICKIRDPRNDRVIAGASQCEATYQNIYAKTAVKKAYRNAIRQAMSPSYLMYALRTFLPVKKVSRPSGAPVHWGDPGYYPRESCF